MDLLRFITCGSVDDGKSTLLGRLLYDRGWLAEDQLAALAADSRRSGTQGEALDFALLLDGLSAEREQGITIDVAYRYFATARRKFIVADTPGHEQYTRNMVTGASTADAAIVLVDARKGVLGQTRRHSYIASLLGIRHLILAVNKMDLVDWSEARFEEIAREFRAFAGRQEAGEVACVPISALHGDNLGAASPRMPWYTGGTVLACLEAIPVSDQALRGAPFRMPVQWVNRPHQDFRGFAGTVASGSVRPGDRVQVLPSGRQTRVAAIHAMEGDLPEASAGQSVTLSLADEIDASRGDLISDAVSPAQVANQFEATLVWMDEAPMLRGRAYAMKLGARGAMATVAPLKYRVNVETLEHVAAEVLQMNEIGVCELELDQPVAFDPYTQNRDTGGFILIDRLTNRTVGAGMLRFALRRSANLHWHAFELDRRARAARNGHRPGVLWMTGISGAGKSTIADHLEKRLHALGCHTYLLDGDNVRHGLNKDLGFTDADRVENIRRVAEVARLMADAGLIVIAAFISPFRSERRMARELMPEGEFFEVHVDATLAEAERRDPKGLYRKARAGLIRNFTGIDSPYEPPERPEIRIDTARMEKEEAAEHIIGHLRKAGLLSAR